MAKETVKEQVPAEEVMLEQEQVHQDADNEDTLEPEPVVEDVMPKHDEYKHWVKMSHEQMLAAQANGTLCGYNPHRGLGLVNKETKKK